jgi:hypothetical protein
MKAAPINGPISTLEETESLNIVDRLAMKKL